MINTNLELTIAAYAEASKTVQNDEEKYGPSIGGAVSLDAEENIQTISEENGILNVLAFLNAENSASSGEIA